MELAYLHIQLLKIADKKENKDKNNCLIFQFLIINFFFYFIK